MQESPSHSGCRYIWWGGFTRISSNHGKSWSDHQYLPHLPNATDIIPGKRHSCGGCPRGQAIEVNGELLLPVYKYLEAYQTDSCHLYVSKDQGKNWAYRAMIAADENKKIYFHEASLIQCGNNKIMAFMRTARTGDHLYTTVSSDQGKTWDKPIKREEVVGHPTHPLRLLDGRIFISYGYRHKPYGIRGRLLDSYGEAFLGDELIIRDDGDCADLGYPWSVQFDNSDILVVYYFTAEDGVRHIAGSVVKV